MNLALFLLLCVNVVFGMDCSLNETSVMYLDKSYCVLSPSCNEGIGNCPLSSVCGKDGCVAKDEDSMSATVMCTIFPIVLALAGTGLLMMAVLFYTRNVKEEKEDKQYDSVLTPDATGYRPTLVYCI